MQKAWRKCKQKQIKAMKLFLNFDSNRNGLKDIYVKRFLKDYQMNNARDSFNFHRGIQIVFLNFVSYRKQFQKNLDKPQLQNSSYSELFK
ncbi:hypothetical protein BpHYR1_007469 [Brachionus plicatilis]|uniref:Uncharacterized protein n=1 Tax=Brachionus plicatilis TaxID=10195 RepID=A0A3M7Q558_BRAPC|nr:hypothetical protein BpHYR1_007469 [Brachionus plicatilis]